jgi:Concanavalin A-like lectin/glucanases superfamily/Bacterial Ig-like domain
MKHRYRLNFRLAGRLLIIAALIIPFFFSRPAIPTRADSAGFALAFDGINALVELHETSLMMASTWTTTKTVELWVKPEGPAVDCGISGVAACDYILGDRPEWWGITRGIVNGLDRIWLYNFDGNMDQIGVPYTAGVWVHIALVHGNGILRAYKNGIEIASKASGPTQQPSTGAYPVLYLGGTIFNAERVYTLQGQIDEVRIWNIARSTTEINADMQRLLTGDEPGLAAYYQMSDGAGLTLTDDSINIWNGTLLDYGPGVLPNGSPPQWVTSGAFDVIQPSVTINQASSQTDPTNTSPITFDVVFSEDMTGFSAPADLDLSASTVGGTLSASISGSGANYTVTVTGMNGEGEVIASIPAGVAQNASSVGNSLSTSSDNSVTFDNTPPTVTINQADSQADPTNASPINFTVTFSEAVNNFTADDVVFTGVAGTATVNVTGGPTTHNVAVSGMVSGETVAASIDAGVAQDAAGNPNQASTSTDNTVTFDNTTPTVTINQADSQADPTNTSPVNFTIVFSEAVNNFTADDVTITGVAGTTAVEVTGGPTTYNVAVSGMASGETVTASIEADVAQDAAGNGNSASTSSDNSVTFDNIAPAVTINQAEGQTDPTNTSPVNFTVIFTEAVDSFTAENVTIAGIADSPNVEVTGGPATFNVAVSGMTSSETVTASIEASVAQDAAGNGNSASTSTDNTVTYIDHYWTYLPIISR